MKSCLAQGRQNVILGGGLKRLVSLGRKGFLEDSQIIVLWRRWGKWVGRGNLPPRLVVPGTVHCTLKIVRLLFSFLCVKEETRGGEEKARVRSIRSKRNVKENVCNNSK